MEELKKRILREGKVICNGNILKVDSFIDHQIDAQFMSKMADEFIKHFSEIKIIDKIDKIITVETSGIAVAVFVGVKLKVPVIYARKKIPVTLTEKLYSQRIISPTKGDSVELGISSKFLKEGDAIYLIDDFLATGETSIAILDIVSMAKAIPLGVGALIENRFLNGAQKIKAKYPSVDIFTLVKIKKMEEKNNIIQFL